MVVSERQRDSREGWLLSLTPHWGHIFIFTPRSGWSIIRPPLSTPLMGLIRATSQHSVTGSQGQSPKWLLLWQFASPEWLPVLWICVPLTANLLSLYDIYNARTFSFWFPIHVIIFVFPLFIIRCDIILFRNPQLICCQRSICNKMWYIFQHCPSVIYTLFSSLL